MRWSAARSAVDRLFRLADMLLSAVLWLIAAGGVALAWSLGLLASLLYALGVVAFGVLVGGAALAARKSRRP